MAEYYPLLDRAVSGLTEQTAEARRSIYERARTALIGQLRRMEPAVPEEDIARESAALDEAIARVESRFAGAETARREAAPAAARRAEPAPPALPPRPPVPAADRVAPPILPTGTAPPVVPSPSRERPVLGQRPAPSVDPPPAAPTRMGPARATTPAGAPPPRGTRPVMALRPVAAPILPVAGRLTPAAEPAAAPAAEDAAALDPAPAEAPSDDSRMGGFDDALDEAARRDGEVTASRARDAALRPPAPRPRRARRFGWPYAVGAALAVAAMGGIGTAAYRMRDKPEQVVATRSDAASAEATQGKSAERASPAAANDPAAGEGAAGNGSTGNDAAESAEPGSGAAVPAPVGQNGSDAAAAPAIAVAQRAALLVDAPEEPQRVRTYVGTVVWHLDSVSPGGGQPLATAVKADVDIPDAKLKVTMLMQRNPEPQLPASHTIEFHFLPQSGAALGGVKQINVPEMRRDDDAPTGDALSGVPVAITDNYFLVGLSRGAAEPQNTRLIAERNWFDVGFLFSSGKLGKLTFEKGAAGARTFDDALKSWR